MGTTADGNHSVRTLTPRDGRVGRRIIGGGVDGITQGGKVNEDGGFVLEGRRNGGL